MRMNLDTNITKQVLKWRVEVTVPLCPGCPCPGELIFFILVCVGNFDERILSFSS